MAINGRALPYALVVAALLAFAPKTNAQVDDVGAVASYAGTISSAKQRDIVTLDVNSEAFTFNSFGRINLSLVLKATPGSNLDPGAVSVDSERFFCSLAATVGQRKDHSQTNDAITLASMRPCLFELIIQSEKKTTGAYRLDVLLSGDVDGDLAVDARDVQGLDSAMGKRIGQTGYLLTADVDRNGVINLGDRIRLLANYGASAKHQSDYLPVGALALLGVDRKRFNDPAKPLQFALVGAEFDLRVSDVTLMINGVELPHAFIAISPNTIEANAVLADGKNVISLKAYDTRGWPLYLDETVWFGSQFLEVLLKNPDGSAFLQDASVIAQLSDDPAVIEQGTTAQGAVTFANVPNRTIIVQTKSTGNAIGSAGVVGGGQLVITMLPFEPLSTTKNLAFDFGATGWKIGGTVVSIIPHLEEIPGFEPEVGTTLKTTTAAAANNDLQLATNGKGARNISHTFTTNAGTSSIRIRYRFVTSEVPGGWFGSEFNDYYSVSIRSLKGGGVAGEADSMNGLGLAAFDFASGSTAWRDEVLLLDPDGDTIQVDVSVANVADGLLDSYIIVDFIEEQTNVVTPSLAWNNAAGGIDLSYHVGTTLSQAATIDVFWASKANLGSRIGSPITTFEVPAGTPAGTYGPSNIPGSRLVNDPLGAHYLIASSSTKQVAPLADVLLLFGGTARRSDVADNARDVISDGLRFAGQSVGSITSTARTPEDQTRIMFNNLTKTENIRANIQAQLAIYATPGRAVIQVFEQRALALGMILGPIRANELSIRADMLAELFRQGPTSVSNHLWPPSVMSVMDIERDPFNLVNRGLFVQSVAPRSYEFLIEPKNHCYHSAVTR